MTWRGRGCFTPLRWGHQRTRRSSSGATTHVEPEAEMVRRVQQRVCTDQRAARRPRPHPLRCRPRGRRRPACVRPQAVRAPVPRLPGAARMHTRQGRRAEPRRRRTTVCPIRGGSPTDIVVTCRPCPPSVLPSLDSSDSFCSLPLCRLHGALACPTVNACQHSRRSSFGLGVFCLVTAASGFRHFGGFIEVGQGPTAYRCDTWWVQMRSSAGATDGDDRPSHFCRQAAVRGIMPALGEAALIGTVGAFLGYCVVILRRHRLNRELRQVVISSH